MSEKLVKYILLFIVLLEGFTVMFLELAAAGLMHPCFGNSIYTWSAIVGLSLAALCIGYYLGGVLSAKVKKASTVCLLLVILGAYISAFTAFQTAMLDFFSTFPVKKGALIYGGLLLIIPLALCGAIAPIVIKITANKTESAGLSSGKIFGTSTLGGIISAFYTGFYVLPTYGVEESMLLVSWNLIVIGLMSLIFSKPVMKVLLLALTVGVIGIIAAFCGREKQVQLLYASDGVLGQIQVYDHSKTLENKREVTERVLLINNYHQALMDANSPNNSLWERSYYFSALATVLPGGSNALMLGLGGGTFAKDFKRLGFKVDAIELDPRIEEVAKKFFYLPAETSIIIDDARHYLNIATKKYDLIHVDLFSGECPAFNCMSVEAFEAMSNILNDNGLILFNYFGYLNGSKGASIRAIAKSLDHVGFTVSLLPTPGIEAARSIIIIASKGSLPPDQINFLDKSLPSLASITPEIIPISKLNLQDTEVLLDENSKFEALYRPVGIEIRGIMNQTYAKSMLKTK